MTLQDLIDFLRDEAQEQTLSETAITRCVLLAYELGLEAGRQEAHPQPALATRRRAGGAAGGGREPC